MYINRSKTKMFCILVFLNYHASFVLWLCASTLSLRISRSNPSAICLVIHTRVLAKSRSICQQSLYATTSSYLIQVFPWTSPFYSHIKTIGLSSFPKVINYSFVLRIPWSLSTPKSGNVCGRRYNGRTHISWWNSFPSGGRMTGLSLPVTTILRGGWFTSFMTNLGWCYVLADVADQLGPGGGFLRCQRVPNALGNDERGSIGNLCTMTLVESMMAEWQQATYALCH